ncbi:MAG: flagellar basal body-associated FliL family protein [Kofleriaceae bacterium]
MSDAGKEAKPPAPAGARPSPIILGLAVLNLGASGFAAFKLATAKPAHAAAAHAEAPPPAPPGNEIEGPLRSLDPFVVNLNEPGSARYLKVVIEFEMADAKAAKAADKSKQVIRDEILRYLSGLNLAATLGAEAKDKIRDDLQARVDAALGEGRVRRMFFQEFVVQ